MARNRMIKPEFWEDSKIALLSDKAKLLFIALWNFADDEGFLENNANWIAVKCFPYEKNVKIEKILAELFKIGVIFEKNGIIQIKNFLKHQKINRPNKSELSQKFNEQSVNTHEPFSEPSLPKKKLKEVKLKESEVKGKESVKGKPSGETPQPPFSNSQKDLTANGNGKQQTAKIPTGYKQLVDYLIANYGYDKTKAELVANRAQSDNFVLTSEHCDAFSAMQSNDIIASFDAMKRIKTLQKKSSFITAGKILNNS